MSLEKSLSVIVRNYLYEISDTYEFTESIVKFIIEKYQEDEDSEFWGDYEPIIQEDTSRLFKMVLMSLFGLFEAFNKDFFTSLLSVKSECMKTKDKKLNYEEILSHNSFEELHHFIALQETDMFGRNDIDYLAKFLKKKFKIEIISEFKDWEKLRESYYRRNVVVHNRSKVSNDYINKINNYGPTDLNKELKVTYEYIEQCHDYIWNYIEWIFKEIIQKFKLEVKLKDVLDLDYPEEELFKDL
ncbi:MAG: hypothetical protein ACFFBC_14425 [Promethearchaeota archaeon]